MVFYGLLKGGSVTFLDYEDEAHSLPPWVVNAPVSRKWLDRSIEHLRSLSDYLVEDHDGFLAPTSFAIEAFEALIGPWVTECGTKRNLPMPDGVTVGPDREIELHWKHPNWQVIISLKSRNEMNAVVFLPGANRRYELQSVREVPESLFMLLEFR